MSGQPITLGRDAFGHPSTTARLSSIAITLCIGAFTGGGGAIGHSAVPINFGVSTVRLGTRRYVVRISSGLVSLRSGLVSLRSGLVSLSSGLVSLSSGLVSVVSDFVATFARLIALLGC